MSLRSGNQRAGKERGGILGTDLFARLVREEQGQDLIEYALLTALIGFACIAAFDLIRSAIYNVYLSWNNSANSNWRPPDPTPW